MEKRFNVTGTCFPRRHYMVDLTERVAEIKKMIDNEDYFAINRGRQYGKTTTLYALQETLSKEYVVIGLDFQKLSANCFATESIFAKKFVESILEELKYEREKRVNEDAIKLMKEFVNIEGKVSFDMLSDLVTDINIDAPTPIVVVIDEVDSASNYEVFIDFLAMLRLKYLDREKRATFHSVVLAGVYDVRHLKTKIRPESQHKVNSPWNIASEFNVRMWFNPEEIAGMLSQYESDHHSGMNIEQIAQRLFDYTHGYPVIVSWLCKTMAEKLDGVFTIQSLTEAVTMMLQSRDVAVFGSLVHHISDYPELKKLLKALIYSDEKIQYVPYNYEINLGLMFSYLKKNGNDCVMANWIFEQFLLKYFVAEDSQYDSEYTERKYARNMFIKSDGRLDMDLVMEKFVEHYQGIYSGRDDRFVEKMGRKLFMLYLKPLINGSGNFYVEAETKNATRSDLIIDYAGEQFVVEMKIWRGDEYNSRGEKQLTEYLDYFNTKKGYMLSFCFNMKKEIKLNKILVGDKTILEAVV